MYRILQNLFPGSLVTHLPIPSSDNVGLWLRFDISGSSSNNQGYFKFLGPWLDHPDFRNQVVRNWRFSSSWGENICRLTASLKIWNKAVYGNIFRKKQRILRWLEGINCILMTSNIQRLCSLRDRLWEEYNSILNHEEAYWFHKAKSKWVVLGDKNTRYFHQKTLVRQRRNRITALLNSNEEWVYDDT